MERTERDYFFDMMGDLSDSDLRFIVNRLYGYFEGMLFCGNAEPLMELTDEIQTAMDWNCP